MLKGAVHRSLEFIEGYIIKAEDLKMVNGLSLC